MYKNYTIYILNKIYTCSGLRGVLGVSKLNPFPSRPFFRVKKIKLVGWSGLGEFLCHPHLEYYTSFVKVVLK